jgi:lysozyme
MNLDSLLSALAKDEGRSVNSRGRHMPYKCPADKLTIGYGRNIEDNGISEGEAIDLLTSDAIQAHRDAAALVPNWLKLNDVRQNVLANMAFQLGEPKLARFRKLLAAVNEERFEDAAYEMMMSAWYGQSGVRSIRLKSEMLTGHV